MVQGALVMYMLQPVPTQAVESASLSEKDGQYVFVESMDPATRLSLEPAYEKGIITQDERDKAINESETQRNLCSTEF